MGQVEKQKSLKPKNMKMGQGEKKNDSWPNKHNALWVLTGSAEGHKGLGVLPEDGPVLHSDWQPGHEEVEEIQWRHRRQVPLQFGQNQQLHLLGEEGAQCGCEYRQQPKTEVLPRAETACEH